MVWASSVAAAEGPSAVKVAILETAFDFTRPELVGRNFERVVIDPALHRGEFTAPKIEAMERVNRAGHEWHGARVLEAFLGVGDFDGDFRGGPAAVPPPVLLVQCPVVDWGVDGDGGTGFAAALDAAAERGARVVNLSFGLVLTEWEHAGWQSLYRALERHPEMLFVVAAGNDGKDLDLPEYEVFPAELDLPNFITVASASMGVLDRVSNFGFKSVDLAVERDGYDSATSFAAPVVARAAARAWAAAPELSAAEVVALLRETVKPVRAIQDEVVWGGVLDEEAAVALRR